MSDIPGIIGGPAPAGGETVGEFFEREFVPYLYDTSADERCASLFRTMRLYVLPLIGGMPVRDVRRSDVQSVCRAQRSEAASSACRDALCALYSFAQYRGAARANPAATGKVDKLDRATSLRALFLPTFRQICELIDVAAAKKANLAAARAVALGYGCGLTFSAMRELGAEGVDLLRLRIRLGGEDGGFVPVVPSVAARLSRLLPDGGGPVMANQEGEPYAAHFVRHSLDKLSLSEALPPIDFATMRSSFAAALLNEGASGPQAALYLGRSQSEVKALARRGEERAMAEALGTSR